MKKINLFFILFILCLSNKLYSENISEHYHDTILYTPNGTAVTAWVLDSADLNDGLKSELKNYYLNFYNNDVDADSIFILREATMAYNCHGFAWHACGDGGDDFYILTPENNKYWDDGSYIPADSSDINAMLLSFGLADHSAVKSSTPRYYQSKWGYAHVFKHTLNDCPYDISDLHFFKRCLPVTYLNINFNNSQTITGCHIILQDVSISNNSNIIIDSEDKIDITSAFNIYIGSSLLLQ